MPTKKRNPSKKKKKKSKSPKAGPTATPVPYGQLEKVLAEAVAREKAAASQRGRPSTLPKTVVNVARAVRANVGYGRSLGAGPPPGSGETRLVPDRHCYCGGDLVLYVGRELYKCQRPGCREEFRVPPPKLTSAVPPVVARSPVRPATKPKVRGGYRCPFCAEKRSFTRPAMRSHLESHVEGGHKRADEIRDWIRRHFSTKLPR